MQDEIFPDEDDFGRIFRNNSVISAAGLPQFAAIMGNCIAGGAYLPVLSDKILMTEGSGLYLAGPALVKAAIGQETDSEELGGAEMHADISGTVDFHEKDDASCIKRLRSLMAMLPQDPVHETKGIPERVPTLMYEQVDGENKEEYDVHDIIRCIVDADTFEEVKPNYGPTLVCGYARIGDYPVGIVANQRQRVITQNEGLQIGGVIYAKSADKAARFVMDCNQMEIPIIFLQDVMGFMVGKDAEQSGIIRSGAKLVNALSNAIVPKLTVILGGSFGAGNYAMCGKAYDPRFIFAWPNAQYAVMGADQASGVIFRHQQKSRPTGRTRPRHGRARKTPQRGLRQIRRKKATSATAPPAAGSTTSSNPTAPAKCCSTPSPASPGPNPKANTTPASFKPDQNHPNKTPLWCVLLPGGQP